MNRNIHYITYARTLYRFNIGYRYMQERRIALISAAVTGKIDVRGWVAPE